MDLVESPRDRLKTVTLGLFSHKSGPNILLGIFIGALIQTLAPDPRWWVIGSALAWTASVVAYAVADEVATSIEEQRDRLLEPESRYYGIE